MRRTNQPHRRGPVHRALGVITLAGFVAACGGDDDASTDATATTTTVAPVATSAPTTSGPPAAGEAAPASVPPELAEFCAVAAELNAKDGPPTGEDIETYAAAAPAELAEPMAVILDALAEAGGDIFIVFADAEAGAAIEQVTAFETEACGFEAGEEGPPQDPSVTVVDPDATRVDVEASDYRFDADFPTDAGRHSFVMANRGEEAHLMVLVHLEEGAEISDVLSSEGESGATAIFESDIAPPGGEAVVTADLVPGRWVLLCPIPTPQGPPHHAEGMIHEFTIG